MPPELLAQFPLAEEALEAIGVVVWPMVEFEADDALGAAAARWADDPDVDRVVILSPDKDMAQCVREDGRVVTYDRRKRLFIDADGVREKFGVSPASIPDFLALVGDSSDGYPGIPGWGAVSTGAVLRRYPHLEDIPESVRMWDVGVRGAATLAAALRERRDEALLYRELATPEPGCAAPPARSWTSCAGGACHAHLRGAGRAPGRTRAPWPRPPLGRLVELPEQRQERRVVRRGRGDRCPSRAWRA